jgi:hypothetical protein
MTTRSMLKALTSAILRGQMDVETARALVIAASADQRQQEQTEVQQMLTTCPTADVAAKALGISKATLYRRLAKSAAGGA